MTSTDNRQTVSLIAAVGRNNEIGCRGDLAFHIRADLRHFKELTIGKPVVMGRRTFRGYVGRIAHIPHRSRRIARRGRHVFP